MASTLNRVFPERNRTALEGSPERSALEENYRDPQIETTYGHIATKVWEILAGQVPADHIKPVVLSLFPTESHRESVLYGAEQMLGSQLDSELRTLFVLPLQISRKQLRETLKREIEPLRAEANKGTLNLSGIRKILLETTFSDVGVLKPEQQATVHEELAYAMGREYELVEGEEQDPLDPKDLNHLPEIIADIKYAELIRAEHEKIDGLIAQMKGHIVLTVETRQQLESKYPIKPGN